MVIDHLTVPVRAYDVSKPFYEQALQPLGLVVLLDWRDKRRVYFGVEHEPSSLWLVESWAAGSLDVTLAAPDPRAVDAFHAAAVAAGARSDWAPEVRAEHSSDYYAARVLDPDGNSIEAVYRGTAEAAAARESFAA
jgi:catechol 2,3-dioxygenase-like lactoylglutathione lyase family enzyme